MDVQGRKGLELRAPGVVNVRTFHWQSRMAELDFILQAVTGANHAEAVQALLAIPNPAQVVVSVAYVREPGIEALEAAIAPLGAEGRAIRG